MATGGSPLLLRRAMRANIIFSLRFSGTAAHAISAPALQCSYIIDETSRLAATPAFRRARRGAYVMSSSKDAVNMAVFTVPVFGFGASPGRQILLQ